MCVVLRRLFFAVCRGTCTSRGDLLSLRIEGTRYRCATCCSFVSDPDLLRSPCMGDWHKKTNLKRITLIARRTNKPYMSCTHLTTGPASFRCVPYQTSQLVLSGASDLQTSGVVKRGRAHYRVSGCCDMMQRPYTHTMMQRPYTHHDAKAIHAPRCKDHTRTRTHLKSSCSAMDSSASSVRHVRVEESQNSWSRPSMSGRKRRMCCRTYETSRVSCCSISSRRGSSERRSTANRTGRTCAVGTDRLGLR